MKEKIDESMADFDKSEVFGFLEDLRESGVTNMFGAGPYLVREFGMSRNQSHEWLQKWMDSYKESGK